MNNSSSPTPRITDFSETVVLANKGLKTRILEKFSMSSYLGICPTP